MIGLAKQKVPSGKLLIVKLEYEDKIISIELLGDFFMYPEEAIYKIEDAIKGMDVNVSEADIISKVREITDNHSITMLGITPESIAQTVKAAVSK